MKVLGIDIGGTKIRMGIVDSNGQVVEDHKIPTESPLYPYLEKKIIQFPLPIVIGSKIMKYMPDWLFDFLMSKELPARKN